MDSGAPDTGDIAGMAWHRAGFRPAPGLGHPHVQSVLSTTWPRRSLVRGAARPYRAQAESYVLDCGDGVRLLGHYNASPAGAGRLAVLLHGWEGSSDSVYNLALGPQLLAEGFDTFRLNLRDHGESHHLNRGLFHSCRLQEVVDAVGWIAERYADRTISLVGFSLGGNFALRVGRESARAGLSLERIVAVCPVLDPAVTMRALDAGSALYRQYFLQRWRRSLAKKSRAFPTDYDFRDLRRFTNLTAMTDYFVREYTEYPDIETYLNGYAITRGRLDGLTVPAAVLLADDDPVIPIASVSELQVPPSMRLYRTERGGHCGFIDNWRLESFANDFVIEQLGPARG